MVNETPPDTSPWREGASNGFSGGSPPGPQYVHPAPQLGRRQRPSPWWFVYTGALFLLACGLAVALIAGFARGLGKLSEVNATVTATGTPEAVRLSPHTSYLLWDQIAYRDECSVIDQQTGTPVATSSLGATSYHRTDRSGAWYGARYVDSGSGILQVTCAAYGGPIQFGARPTSGNVLGNTGLTVLTMVVSGTAGLVGFIVTLVLFITGEPRTTRSRAMSS